MSNGSGVTTVFVVRHAERDESNPNDRDPHLTEAGRARAQALAHVLGSAGVRAVYTSTFVRTQETAQPLASLKALQPVRLDQAAQLRQDILSRHAGKVVLVVGHSDTGPELIRLLGGGGFRIGEREFDRLFVVQVFGPGRAAVAELRYGAPSPFN
ncbi:MAG: hypothetical protein QOG71_3871 [Pyrinomonadaceae bacterium]|nr:hypothetical protein [Pyrinomonadaceae bacterium]